MDPRYHGVGYMDPDFRWHLNGYGRNEYPHPHPRDIHEAIQRGIEKERIREEIIMSEIVRRRVLEAEVRRELMMEREVALRQGNDGFTFGSSPVPSLLVTKVEGWSAEERFGMALEDKEKLKRSKNGGLQTLPFQRGTADLRISEVKSASEGNKEKERLLLLTKPDENVYGSKSKDITPPEVVNIELLADVIANKKSKEEWSCALCQVMAASEKDLNGHLLGKKHKSNVAALRAQKTRENFTIGLFPKKAAKSSPVEEKAVKSKGRYLFSKKAGETTSKKDDLRLSKNPKSEHLKKTQAEVIQKKVQKNEDDPRKKVQKNEHDPRNKGCKFSEVMNANNLGNLELPTNVIANKKSKVEWRCALCQVIATSDYDLNEHVLGKKHKSKLASLRTQRTGENNCTGLSPKRATESIYMEEEGVKPNAKSLFSEKVREGTSKKDDLPLVENPKSEHLKKTRAELIQKVKKNEDHPGKKAQKNEDDPRKNGPEKAKSLFSEKAREATSNKYDLTLLENPKSEHLKNTRAEVIRKVQKNEDAPGKKAQKNEDDPRKNGCKFWCELCQIGTSSSEDMKDHKSGKKHVSRLRRCEQYGDTNSFNQKKSVVPVDPVHDISGNGKDINLGQFNQTLDEVSPEDHMLLDAVKHKEREGKPLDFEVVNIELPADVTADKKSKEEWSCALCQVSATSERRLNEHMHGKKHKSREAALRS